MMDRATGIIAIRPEPGLTSTMKLGREFGFEIAGKPLFEIRPLDWSGPNSDSIDALLIGSANAIQHGGKELELYLEKPIHAVGSTTAEAARKAGFDVARTGSGGLQSVLDEIAPPARLLRIAGADHVVLAAREGIEIQTVIAYESVALPLDPHLIERAGDRPLILLHSAAAATHFAAECNRLGIERNRLGLAALGPRIAAAAGEGWGAVHIAPRPSDRQMLASLRGACI